MKDWGQEEKRATEGEMVGWHQELNGQEFEQTPADSIGQTGLACYSPWGCKESDMTQWPNNNKNKMICTFFFFNLATLNLSCGMWDLVPWSGNELRPLHWEFRVLTTGPPGKFSVQLFQYTYSVFSFKKYSKLSLETEYSDSTPNGIFKSIVLPTRYKLAKYTKYTGGTGSYATYSIIPF